MFRDIFWHFLTSFTTVIFLTNSFAIIIDANPIDHESSGNHSSSSGSSQDPKLVELDVILRPKARLYSWTIDGNEKAGDTNLWTNIQSFLLGRYFEDFNFDQKENPECTNLIKLSGNVKSLDTFGTCVRLYDQYQCWGQSMAFYPQAHHDPEESEFKKFLKNVKAVGPCLENELEGSQVVNISQNSEPKLGYSKLKDQKTGQPLIPDLITFGTSWNTVVRTGSNPITEYKTGIKGRVEYIQANLLPSIDRTRDGKIKQFNVTQADLDFYNKLDKQDGDQIGHFLSSPQEGLEFHNIFPQTGANRNEQIKFEMQLLNWLAQNGGQVEGQSFDYLRVAIKVDYQNETTTRPTGTLWHVHNGELLAKRFTRIKYFSNVNI